MNVLELCNIINSLSMSYEEQFHCLQRSWDYLDARKRQHTIGDDLDFQVTDLFRTIPSTESRALLHGSGKPGCRMRTCSKANAQSNIPEAMMVAKQPKVWLVLVLALSDHALRVRSISTTLVVPNLSPLDHGEAALELFPAYLEFLGVSRRVQIISIRSWRLCRQHLRCLLDWAQTDIPMAMPNLPPSLPLFVIPLEKDMDRER